jgi:hypothetical protein
VVTGLVCVALGSHSFVRTRSIPVVSSLAAAVPDIRLDAADDPLDRQYYSHLLNVALARTRPSMGIASCVGHVGGIRMPCNRRCGDCVAPKGTVGSTPDRLGKKKHRAKQQYCIQRPSADIFKKPSQFTEE